MDGNALIVVLFVFTALLAAGALYFLVRFADRRYATIET